jgi:ElaB/YqjD/DUF883 family membrane-anchored ribosome-binding protein
MNQQPDLDSDAIRSDIDNTRERMDETINELGNRFDGRHLVDEVFGFFRRSESGAAELGSKLSRSTQAAVSSVATSVKENPVPALLIGAGVAWLIFKNRSSRSSDSYEGEDYRSSSSPDYVRGQYAGAYTDQPLEQQSGSVASQAKEKLSNLGEQAREKLSAVGERGRETYQAARGKVGEVAQQVQERGRQIYGRTREQVATTAEQHPLEVGLACLAIGLVAGLAIPTSNRVNRSLGPTVDRLKQQTREKGSELVEKGKRVVQAATSAAKEEAQAQGLTAEKLRGEARAVASRASDAGMASARQEGLAPQSSGSGQQDQGSAQNQNAGSTGGPAV